MKLKHLESALSSIQREFPSPKVELEQYPTSAHLAAWVGLTALENGDIGEGRSSLDLGCGTGMLAMSCALLGTDCVLAVDCDEEALNVANENAQTLELEDEIEMILAKVNVPAFAAAKQQQQQSGHKAGGKARGGRGRGRQGRGNGRSNNQQSSSRPLEPIKPSVGAADDGIPLRSNCVDTVITNPPFGTKQNAGMDVQFLRTAVRLARRAVYSFHKTSTRPYLVKTLRDEWGLDVKVVAEMRFDIPKMYEFHQQKSVDVEVDLIRVGLPLPEEEDEVEEIAAISRSLEDFELATDDEKDTNSGDSGAEYED